MLKYCSNPLRSLKIIAMKMEKEIVKYILKKVPDQHPFRLSRYLFLIDLEYFREHGEKLTEFYYQLFPEAFYIDGFPQLLESIPEIEKVVEYDENGNPKRGFFRLVKEVDVDLPEEIRQLIDRVLDKYSALSDAELNRAVVETPEYQSFLYGD